MIPMILQIKVNQPEKKKINLWLPIFLLWPILIFVFLLILPFVLLVGIIFLFLGKGNFLLRVWSPLIDLILGLKGFRVEVEEGDQQVLIAII